MARRRRGDVTGYFAKNPSALGLITHVGGKRIAKPFGGMSPRQWFGPANKKRVRLGADPMGGRSSIANPHDPTKSTTIVKAHIRKGRPVQQSVRKLGQQAKGLLWGYREHKKSWGAAGARLNTRTMIRANRGRITANIKAERGFPHVRAKARNRRQGS